MEKQFVLIDSEDNLLGVSHNPVSVTVPENIYAYSAKLCHFNSPNVWYNITTNNNSLTVDYNGGGDSELTITPGKYSMDDFRTALQTKLVTVDPGFVVDAYNETTQRAVIRNTNNAFTINFKDMGTRLGYVNNTVLASVNDTDDILTATGPVEMEDNELYVDIAQFRSLGQSTSASHRNVSFLVTVDVGRGDIVYHSENNYWEQKCQLLDDNIQSLDVTIRDRTGNKLEGMGHWSMVLCLMPRECRV